MTMFVIFIKWAILSLIICAASSSYPSSYTPAMSYGPKESFLPAESGETPKCVKDPRLTFCVDLDDYPKDRILYLLKNNMFDTSTFLQSESRDTYVFETREPPEMKYGYPPPQPSTSYARSLPSSNYLPPTANHSRSGGQRSKYSSGQYHFKLPGVPTPTVSSDRYYPNSTTPAHNSFSTSGYKNKDRYRSGRFSTATTYQRFPKRNYGGTSTSSHNQNHRWKKRTSRRMKRQTDLSDLCPSQTSYINPRAAQSVGGDWMYLVNVDDTYVQLVTSETCIQNTCEGTCDIPIGFMSICQQQYVQKRLVALDGSGSKLNQDTFWFPSCCVCKIRSN